MLHEAQGPCGVMPYVALFLRDRASESLPLPVLNVAEDPVAFMRRVQQADLRLKTLIEADKTKSPDDKARYAAGDVIWVIRLRDASAIDKFAPWWDGPMVVEKRLGQHTYSVQVKEEKLRASHVSQIKRGVEDPSRRPMPLYFTKSFTSGRRDDDVWECRR